jgi:hypothetical protein
VLGIAAGCECVRLRLVDQVDARHRQFGTLGKLLHETIEPGRALRVDFARAVHAQDHRIREPVGEKVHASAEEERDQHSLRSANRSADGAEERHDRGHQQARLQQIAHVRLHCDPLNGSATLRRRGAGSR